MDDKDAERRRAGLRKLLLDQDITVTDLARQIALQRPNAVFNFMNGRTNSLSLDTIERILAAYPGVTFNSLVGLPERSRRGPGRPPAASPTKMLVVTALAAAGLWQRKVTLFPGHWTSIPLPNEVPTNGQQLLGVRVRYPGAERLYRDGAILACRTVDGEEVPRLAGARVVVARARRSTVEVTIRELRFDEGSPWLWPCSTHPEQQEPIPLTVADASNLTPATNADTVTLLGVVVASWQLEAPLPTE